MSHWTIHDRLILAYIGLVLVLYGIMLLLVAVSVASL